MRTIRQSKWLKAMPRKTLKARGLSTGLSQPQSTTRTRRYFARKNCHPLRSATWCHPTSTASWCLSKNRCSSCKCLALSLSSIWLNRKYPAWSRVPCHRSPTPRSMHMVRRLTWAWLVSKTSAVSTSRRAACGLASKDNNLPIAPSITPSVSLLT